MGIKVCAFLWIFFFYHTELNNKRRLCQSLRNFFNHYFSKNYRLYFLLWICCSPFISEFKFFNQITSKQVWQPHENEYKGTFCFYSQTSNKMYDKINILRNQRTFLAQFSSNFFIFFLFFFFPTFHIFFFLWCVFVSHQNSKQVQGFQLSLSLSQPKIISSFPFSPNFHPSFPLSL